MLFRLCRQHKRFNCSLDFFWDPIPNGIAETILDAATRAIVISFLHHQFLRQVLIPVCRAGQFGYSVLFLHCPKELRNSTCAINEGCEKNKELPEVKTNR